MDTFSVILAIASPPGHSLRGILRASGEQCFNLVQEHVHERSRVLKRGTHRTHFKMDRVNVPVLMLSLPGPHSYTGEDSIELQTAGNPALLQRMIDAMLSTGQARNIAARRAEPGEFTARAFFNNRISLTQAEGVAATIAAHSDTQLHAAHALTAGTLGAFAHQLADELASALALVEAGIDFTDQEDVIAIGPADLHRRMARLHATISEYLSHSVGIEQLQAIPWVVLTGEPNAGKSALFNALLGRERAVVSSISGTTRDVLAEPLTIQTPHGPAEVMLVDLAGMDDNADNINRLMQDAAREALNRAELILRCVPVNETVNLSEVQPHAEVLVRTKADVSTHRFDSADNSSDIRERVSVSAYSGVGLNDLKSMIANRLAARAVSLSGDMTALHPRHTASLQSAKDNMLNALNYVEPHVAQRSLADPEFIAAYMRAALNDLAALAGDMTPDDVLGRVFASFCIGK